jgi:hypothetical protein
MKTSPRWPLAFRLLPLLPLLLLGVGCSDDDEGKASESSAGSQAMTERLPEAPPEEPPIEKILERRWRGYIRDAGQDIFKSIHPVGRATGTKLHDLEVKWRNDIRTNRESDILAIGVRYSVTWEGPINKDGFTKLYSVYDAELERIIGTDLLATNGVTNGDVAEGVGIAVGLGIQAAMSGE